MNYFFLPHAQLSSRKRVDGKTNMAWRYEKVSKMIKFVQALACATRPTRTNTKKEEFLYIRLITIIILLSFIIPGCSRTEKEAAQPNIMEIREAMFMTHINHIYTNAGEHLGRVIKLEGIYLHQRQGRQEFNIVIRRTTDSCCGTPGMVGFEVAWPENQSKPFPPSESWVEATGIFTQRTRGSSQYYFLELIEIRELQQRGLEFVSR